MFVGNVVDLSLGLCLGLSICLLLYPPIFLRSYFFLKFVSFRGANRTKSASVGLLQWERGLRGAL